MNGLGLVVAVAILIEGLIEYVYKIQENPKQLLSVALGVGISFLFNVQMFQNLGMETYQIADIVLSGIIMSRGSNYVSDWLSKATRGKNAEIITTNEN